MSDKLTSSAPTGITSSKPASAPPASGLPPVAPGLRTWPALLVVAAQAACVLVPLLVDPSLFMLGMLGPMAAGVVLAAWVVFLSRASWGEGIFTLVAFAALGAATFFAVDPSFQFALTMYSLPAATTLVVLWMAVTRRSDALSRQFGVVALLLLVGAVSATTRMDGIDGTFTPEFSWRWSATAEEKTLAARGDGAKTAEPAAEPVVLAKTDWPGFRGPARDGALRGVSIRTDWDKAAPKELWRETVGPGWSSFAAVGDRVYTQEQRGKFEMVTCYDAKTGKEVWAHRDEVRFTEVVAGAGPRATPTYSEGKIYALGAKGNLNCLDASTGKVLWAKDAAKDAGDAKTPTWALASSPLVLGGLVTVYGGDGVDAPIVAYKAYDGEVAWKGGRKGVTYASMHAANIAGVEQILVLTGGGVYSLEPSTGKELWNHDAPMQEGMARCIQPAVIGDDVLLSAGFGGGTQRISVTKGKGGWKTEEKWSSKAMSAYYNDFVVHDGHAYGFDGAFFTCVSLEDGSKKWRQRGYDAGQVLLLADQGLLLIQAEKGDVVLVEANPDKHVVKGRIAKAITGKTWNHPVVAGGKLFVRNGQEMAAFELK